MTLKLIKPEEVTPEKLREAVKNVRKSGMKLISVKIK